VKSEPTNVIIETCEECATDFERPPGRRQRRCPTCRRAALEANIDAQHHKTGPLYEDYVRQQMSYFKSEAKRLGIR
jgi:hypothetical protein